jgi:crotonobetainyl-CoA:carnitine CoA-transferase CaiB-like acyl-CoA transferase
MESLVPDYAVAGYIRGRSGSILPGVAPSNVYRCKDGDYLIGANQDSVFQRLCAAMGQPDLASDPRYATHISRGEHQAELDALIERWTQERTVEEVEAAMIEAAVPAGKIYRAPEMLADPHFAARESLIELDHPRWGKLPMQNAFPKLSRTPGSVRRPASQAVGADNAEVLAQLGIEAAELQTLKDAGIV